MNKTKTLHWKELKPTKPKDKYVRTIVVTLRLNSDEMRQMLGFAHSFTKGNVSEWLRYSALNFKPTKDDLK